MYWVRDWILSTGYGSGFYIGFYVLATGLNSMYWLRVGFYVLDTGLDCMYWVRDWILCTRYGT
jgi:hypothetical protein